MADERESSKIDEFSLHHESLLRLKHLAVHKMMNIMRQSVNEIDDLISENIDKLEESIEERRVATAKRILMASRCVTPAGDGKEEGTPATKGTEVDTSRTEKITLPIPTPPSLTKISCRTMTPKRVSVRPKSSMKLFSSNSDIPLMRRAISELWEARGYLIEVLRDNAAAFLVDIERNDENLHIVQNALQDTPHISVLDFRTLYNWLKKPGSSSSKSLVVPTKNGPELLCRQPYLSVLKELNPPNEFDWVSFEKMNSVIPLAVARDLFDMVSESDCQEQLKELYINASSSNFCEDENDGVFEACSETVGTTLSSLKNLTKLVMRGLCDDNIMKVIGQTCHQLAHLDVSGSQLVTDIGIQNLVFQERKVSSTAFYLIPAWISKNLDKMNPLISKLTYLDYSWTSVTTVARKIFQVVPGCYLYKRLMSTGEDDNFGHHIFLKAPVCYESVIPSKQVSAFEQELAEHVGIGGAKVFVKLAQSHPWRNCSLTVYSFSRLSEDNVNGNNILCGIVTPNKNERRIQGMVQWCNGFMNQLYSIYPVNISLIGNLSSLGMYQGIVSDIWRNQFSLRPDLTQIEIFTEPSTLISFIEFCPSLRKILARIRESVLNDQIFVNVIKTSMCRSVLEDFWVAPVGPQSKIGGSSSCSINPSQCSSSSMIAERVEPDNANSKLNLAAAVTKKEADLVQLSLTSLQALISSCPRLKRVGDLALWSYVEEEELYTYCEQLKQKRHKVVVTWANINLPDFGIKKKRANPAIERNKEL